MSKGVLEVCKLVQKPFLINPKLTVVVPGPRGQANSSRLLMFSETFKKSKRRLTDILENESYNFVSESELNVQIRVLRVEGRVTDSPNSQDEIGVFVFWTLKWEKQSEVSEEPDDERSRPGRRVHSEHSHSEISEIRLNRSINLEKMHVLVTKISFAKNDKSKVVASTVLTKLSPLDPISRLEVFRRRKSRDWFILMSQRRQADHVIEMKGDDKEEYTLANGVLGGYLRPRTGLCLVKTNGSQEIIQWKAKELGMSHYSIESQR